MEGNNSYRLRIELSKSLKAISFFRGQKFRLYLQGKRELNCDYFTGTFSNDYLSFFLVPYETVISIYNILSLFIPRVLTSGQKIIIC